jgi:hypothetical protein
MSWAEGLVEQVCSYSGEGSVVHDDQFDSATQAISVIDWYWLHHLGQKSGAKKPGTIQEDRVSDKGIHRDNPYGT